MSFSFHVATNFFFLMIFFDKNKGGIYYYYYYYYFVITWMLKKINVPQFSLVIKEINYNLQKVLIGWNVIYKNQHVSKALHSATTIFLNNYSPFWNLFSKKTFVSFQQQIARKIKKSDVFLHIVQATNQNMYIIYTFIVSL